MAAELMVINPVRRRKRRAMSAKQKKYFGKRRKSTRRRSVARRNPVAMAASSPRKSRRRRFGRRAAARARSYYRSRSGGRGISGFIGHTLIPAAIGGGGAFLLDMAWDRLPLPDMLKTGVAAPLARIGLAVGVGYAVGMVAGKKYGNEAMAGALAVTAYDLIKTYVIPSIPVAAIAPPSNPASVGYYSAAHGAGMGYFVPGRSGMGLFV